MGFGLTGIGALLTGGDIAASTAGEYGGLEKVYGKKPRVSDFIPLDLQKAQSQSVAGNLANADAIEAFLNRTIPGWSEMLKAGTGNALDLLHGVIPKDVQDQIFRSTAFQSLQSGTQGSGMARALTARDLGRTSLDLQTMGSNSAQSWAKLAESSYSPFVTDTAMQAQTNAANNAGRQATEQFKFNVEAAPDPGAAGAYALNSAIGMQMLNFGMGAAGGAMGGAGAGRGAPAGGPAQPAFNPYASGTNWQYDPSTGTYQPVKWGSA